MNPGPATKVFRRIPQDTRNLKLLLEATNAIDRRHRERFLYV